MDPMRRSLLATAPALVLSACGGGGGGSDTAAGGTAATVKRSFTHQGFNVTDWSVWSSAALDRSLGVAQGANADTLVFDFGLTQLGGLTGSAFAPIDGLALQRQRNAWARAVAAGFKVWIKPRVTVGTDIASPEYLMWWAVDPADPASWFRAYGDRVEQLCIEARAVGVTAVLDGNELLAMTRDPAHASRWSALHERLRSALRGLVGCNVVAFQQGGAAQVDQAPVSYFERLDFVGLSAYPSLTRSLNPTRAEMAAGWTRDAYGENPVARMLAVHARVRKPLVFTEFGSPATRGGVWYWYSPDRPASYVLGQDGYDLVQQRNWYDAGFEVVRRELSGAFVGIVNYCLQGNPGDTQDGYVAATAPESAVINYSWNLHGKPALEAINAGWSR
jgi:hypothetical protein